MLAAYLWFWGGDQGSTWSRGSGDLPEVPEKQGCRNGLSDWEVRHGGLPSGPWMACVPYLQVLPPFTEITWPQPQCFVQKMALALSPNVLS
jgi:hypothetical protein